MKQVDLKEAEEQFVELIELAANGEEIIISKNNRPVAKLLPIDTPKRQRQFGSAKGLIEMTDGFDEPLPDFQEYAA